MATTVNIQWCDQEEKVTRQPKRRYLSGKVVKYREEVHFIGARQKLIERGEQIERGELRMGYNTSGPNRVKRPIKT